MKIQIIGRKVCLRCKDKTMQGIVNKLLKQNVCWHQPATFCLITSSKNLNFHWRWRWGDQIQSIFLNLFYFQKPWIYILYIIVWLWTSKISGLNCDESQYATLGLGVIMVMMNFVTILLMDKLGRRRLHLVSFNFHFWFSYNPSMCIYKNTIKIILECRMRINNKLS